MRMRCGDVWAITCYFNPSGFGTKRANYDRFIRGLRRDGVECLTVECAFGDRAFELPPSPNTLRVRARDVMWQKERLLNLALSRLPASCTKVVWLDCDVLFDRRDWVLATADALDRYAVVQPFDSVVRLPAGVTEDDGRGETWRSFGSVISDDPLGVILGVFDSHGHTGFVWAARREVLAHGLYDACIAGSGDHIMAHAFAGDFDSACVRRVVGSSGSYKEHMTSWSRRVYSEVRARIGYVPGSIRHLWHGERANRKYVQRNRELVELGFDPERDLVLEANGCWKWSVTGQRIRPWMVRYFNERREDDVAMPPVVSMPAVAAMQGGR